MRYGLLGRTLSHSLSPEIHALLGGPDYELFEREEKDLPAFFADASIGAFNVTIPYKVAAFHACDTLSDTAKNIGSVNTVVRNADGTLFGDNTDAYGFLYLARQAGADFQRKKVLVLGSGGASRMVQTVCADCGAKEIVVVSRSGENNYENLHRHFDAQILVNTTPVGMYPNNDASPVDLTPFCSLECVLDLIYNPMRTRLLTQAKRIGIPCLNGLPMLAAQALRSAERFFNKELDEALIDAVCRSVTRSQENIVLIGMPGCGKSTVAASLASALGRKMIDLDTEIVKADGRTIPEIFSADGESVFRALETRAAKDAGQHLGAVIATGGGCVMNEENRLALKQNGVIIYLKRPLASLATSGRPLSKDSAAIQKIFDARKETYEAFADFEVDVSDDVSTTVERVMACICS